MHNNRYREFARSTLIVIIALCLLMFVFAPLTIFTLPRKTTVGQFYLDTLLNPSENVAKTVTSTGGFRDDAPILIDELNALGDDWSGHPLVEDLNARLKELYTAEPQFLDLFQHRNYVYISWMGEDKNRRVFVYRWNDTWEYVTTICETC